jgi:hypothetical protein
MSIQNIINRAQQIEFDRRRMVGQSVSRSQRIKTAERSTGQPWKFKVTPPAQLPWTASRGFIEVIDFNDRVNEYTISLNDNPGMNYITAYQGEMSQAELDALTISTSTTSTLVLTTLPTTASTSVMFKPGDVIQPENSRYPYSVTTTVLRGETSTITVPLHRSIITSENINLMTQGVKVGNSATWQVVVTALPTYSLIPMRQVQYTGDFELIEKII